MGFCRLTACAKPYNNPATGNISGRHVVRDVRFGSKADTGGKIDASEFVYSRNGKADVSLGSGTTPFDRFKVRIPFGSLRSHWIAVCAGMTIIY
jgi:hypothetical protein